MFLKDKLIAHRGIYDNRKIYENTIEAFKLAKDNNYTIELDVHMTKDNEVVVFHDFNTNRLLKTNQIIEESTYLELNKQNIFHMPKFSEVLKLVKGKVPILIEIKNDGMPGLLENKLMEILKEYNGKYAIQSFNPSVIYYFKRKYPSVLRGQLSYSFNDKNIFFRIFLKNLFFNFLTKPDFISYKYDELKYNKIIKLKKKYVVLGWTIDSSISYNKYKSYYDNLIVEKFINRGIINCCLNLKKLI